MAFECVVVKEELAIKEETDNEVSSVAPEANGSENKNIVEIDIPISNIRIKSDLIEPPRSPTETKSSWHVPVAEEVNNLPANFVQVIIKEEEVSEDDEPASEELVSDDGAATQATTSRGDEVNELYHSSPAGGYVCQICRKTFANPGNVQRHLLLHTRETFKCEQCNGQFLNKIRLDRHIFNHHTLPSERLYECNDCPKKFKSSSNLMQHKKTHLKEKPHKCSTCSRTFSFKTNLKKHQGKNRCKIPSDEPLICVFCKKVFEKEYLLKSHLRKHDDERPFACDQCDMTFKHKSTLIRHMQIHNGIRPYPCPVCGKTFTSSGLLKPHMRVHTGEKPYSCELCEKTFAHKHNMQRHMLGHEKVKHTVCDICHKKFPRESRLKYHMRTHVNEKHFLCHVCPKRFSHKQNVLRHYTRKHPGQTYSCTDTDASVALRVWDTIKSKYYDDQAEVILG